MTPGRCQVRMNWDFSEKGSIFGIMGIPAPHFLRAFGIFPNLSPFRTKRVPVGMIFVTNRDDSRNHVPLNPIEQKNLLARFCLQRHHATSPSRAERQRQRRLAGSSTIERSSACACTSTARASGWHVDREWPAVGWRALQEWLGLLHDRIVRGHGSVPGAPIAVTLL